MDIIEYVSELKTPKGKRIFIVFTVLLLVIEIGLLFLIGYFKSKTSSWALEIGQTTFIDLIGATISAIIITSLIIYLLPSEEKVVKIDIVDPNTTKSLHDKALHNTDFWFHRGQIGRWVRTEALPTLDKVSKNKSKNIVVETIIIDPKNIELCNHFLKFKESLTFKDVHIKSLEDVQAELLATVIISQYFFQTSSRMKIKVFLTDTLIFTRDDINSLCTFRTQINPRASTIVYYNINQDYEKSEYYNIAKIDFEYTTQKCVLVCNKDLPVKEKLTVNILKDYLIAIDLLVSSNDNFLKKIIAKVSSDYHPYG